MKKVSFVILILFASIFVYFKISQFAVHPASPKFSKGNPGRVSPPLKSAGNLYPKSPFCSSMTEYTLLTAPKASPNQVCILDLSRQNYTTIPEDVFNYPNLSVLILNDNPISSLKGIDLLPYLTDIEVGNAQLKEFPKEVKKLKFLQVLQLYRNQIEIIPAEIGELKELRNLNLSSNPISSFSEEISKLTKLEWLELRGNKLVSRDREKLIKLLPQTDIEFEYQEGL